MGARVCFWCVGGCDMGLEVSVGVTGNGQAYECGRWRGQERGQQECEGAAYNYQWSLRNLFN